METYAMFPTIRRIPYAIVLHYKFETLNLDMTKHSMTLCYPFNKKWWLGLQNTVFLESECEEFGDEEDDTDSDLSLTKKGKVVLFIIFNSFRFMKIIEHIYNIF